MITYKDKTFCSNSQFCTEDCYRRLTSEDRTMLEVINKDMNLPVAYSDFTGSELCTHEKVGKDDNSK